MIDRAHNPPPPDVVNRRIVLRRRPTGHPGPADFAEDVAPARAPGEGEVLIETLYLSVDPAMRVWMSADPGYVEPVPLGAVMRAGGIGRIVRSSAAGWRPGEIVQGRLGWQSHPTVAAAYLTRLDLALGSPLDWIGPLGGTALTAYFGLHEIARIAAGEEVVVSAAAGGVGQIAAQIARIEGCRVVGIAGGPEKCAYLQGELGLDEAIDYKASPDIAAALERACPRGIDVYFDNVGGPTLDAVLPRLRRHARVALCGRISQTGSDAPYGVRNLGSVIGKHARLEGFLVSDFSADFDRARAWLATELGRGRLRQRLHVLDGLGRAPEGLAMLFRGENTGKLVIRVAPE